MQSVGHFLLKVGALSVDSKAPDDVLANAVARLKREHPALEPQCQG
jgi:hypothetical protein